jgi:NTE family protein
MKALVLSGGGAKGAYQVGVLKKWMYEDGKDYEILCGVSVGAINTSFLAQTTLGKPDASWQKLSDLWDQVDTPKVKKNWFPFGVIEALWKKSVYNSAPLQKWVQEGLDVAAVVASGHKLRVTAVSWDTGESFTATEQDPELAKWVLASSAFPVMLCPIELNGQLWTDGGLRNVTPLGEAIRLGADEIDVVICSDPFGPDPSPAKSKAAFPGLVLRSLDILSDQVMRADLAICGLKNDLSELKPQYKNVKIRLLEPSQGLTDDSLNFDPASLKRMRQIGYEDACRLATGTP